MGCASPKPLIPSEVLRVSDATRIYTSYNIWYTDPANIDCLNILQGEIIPFGTEVRILEANAKKIRFQTVADEQEFCIIYDHNVRLMPVEDFMRRLFITEPLEMQIADVRTLVYEKISRGIVEKGMNRKEVIMAFGPPAAFRTPNEREKTWIFYTDFLVGKRVVFYNDNVIDVIVL